jgi:ubiquinone/menaquinone biosynthesis C-methylase UbiE
MGANTTAYYDATASGYDALHGENEPEHTRALERSLPVLTELMIASVLDVGCGTGRSLGWLKSNQPLLELFGIDPSIGLLRIAKKSLSTACLVQGSGECIPLADSSVDFVIASAIMHHVDHPKKIIAEMFRVARKAVLISDHNNFAFGGTFAKRLRMILRMFGLLGVATYVKQGFRRQGFSEGDGWWYPYSLLENYSDIAALSNAIYLIPTRKVINDSMPNLIFSQSHLAVLALKK